MQLVELNCFYEATGMGLFDYHRDQHALTNGPFEWRVLTEPQPRMEIKMEREWPHDTTIAVVGPAGDEYIQAAQACLAATDGCESLTTSFVPKARLQSIRMHVRRDSPDAFCALHSCLAALPGTKAVV